MKRISLILLVQLMLAGITLWGAKETKSFNETQVAEEVVPAESSMSNKLSTTGLGAMSEEKNTKTELNESQIHYNGVEEEKVPVLTKQKTQIEEQSSSMYKTIVSVFVLFMFGVAGIVYLKRKSLMVNQQSSLMQIKMLTQYHLGPKKTLAVIRVAGESLLIGVTDSQISLIKSLALLDEDIPESTPKNFKQTIDKVDSNNNSGNSNNNNINSTHDGIVPPANTVLKYGGSAGEKDDDFSFASLKSVVDSKLKNIRRW